MVSWHGENVENWNFQSSSFVESFHVAEKGGPSFHLHFGWCAVTGYMVKGLSYPYLRPGILSQHGGNGIKKKVRHREQNNEYRDELYSSISITVLTERFSSVDTRKSFLT